MSAEGYDHPILAYSDKGEFVKDGAPDGLTAWMQVTKETIDLIRSGKLITKQKARAEWTKMAKKFNVSSVLRLLPPPPPPPCEEGEVMNTVSPLMTTTWGQGLGYNIFCPQIPNTFPVSYQFTGCVATAMAQVIRFWQPTNNYNWASMANTYATYESARLSHDAGVAVNMVYGNTVSTAFHAAIPGALINTFGFASAQDIPYSNGDYPTLITELNAGRPVIMAGYPQNGGVIGHEWVCDGYSEVTTYYCSYPEGYPYSSYSIYFHHNWGYNGSSNGFYGYSNWAPLNTSNNFQYSKRAIINIHP